nr:hypothetical protein [Treponema pedis]
MKIYRVWVGVFNTVNLHVYHYAGNNPVKYTDPDGRDIIYLNGQSTVVGNGHGVMLIGNDKDGNKLLGFTLLLGPTDEIFPLTSPNRLYDTLNSVYGESFTSRLASGIKNKFGVLSRMLMDSVFPKR